MRGSRPFAGEVGAAGSELDLAETLELEYAQVVPGRPNAEFAQSRNPLRKIPGLVRDVGQPLYDSTVICEHLDALADGGVLTPGEASRRWRVQTNHAPAQRRPAVRSVITSVR